jgi:hypothetical protein
MFYALYGLSILIGIVNLVCFILVLIRIFQDGQTGLGVACIILLFCFGIGAIITFIVGWMNAGRWGITNIMTLWTVCIVVNAVITGLLFATMPREVIVIQP